MVKQISTVLLNTEKKLYKLLLRKELLMTYRIVKRYPKGFNIKFNLSLCANNPHLQKYCKKILSRASKSIMSRVLKGVNKDIYRLKKQCKNLKVQLVNNLSDKDYKTTYATIRNKVRYMEKAIRRRHSRKLSRDKITEHHNIDNKKRKNRRFSKKQLINKKKLKRVRHKNNYRERIRIYIFYILYLCMKIQYIYIYRYIFPYI